MCRVSVIIPVYNCEKYLQRAVDSVVSQKDFSSDELILVDDGSNDGSGKICDFYKNKYPNVKVIHQPNGGVSAARNAGIEAADGEWIFFLDSDDYVLDSAFSLMLESGDADLISAKHTSNVRLSNNFDAHFNNGVYRTEDVQTQLYSLLAGSDIFYTCWSRLYKKSIIQNNEIRFPVGVKYAEDMVFVYTYLRFCQTLAFTDKAVYHYYVNESNATSVVPKSFDVFYFIYNWQKKYFESDSGTDKEIISAVESRFVYNAFNSFKIAADALPLRECIAYLNEIFKNVEFCELYEKANLSFTYKYDVILDKNIKRKNALGIALVMRFCKLKSWVSKQIAGEKND